MNLNRLFNPRSVAVVGASRNRAKVGSVLCRNILNGGFRGRLYPINPKAHALFGKRSYPTVMAVRGAVDLAVIAVPADAVVPVLIECGKKKIPFAIIVTSGFLEIGPKGEARDRELRAVARKYRIRVLGPNCLGLVHTGSKLNATFASQYPYEGSVSFVSQSGALLVSFIDWSQQVAMGVRALVSLGNQNDISDAEVIEYLSHDPKTSAIGAYVEETASGLKLYKALRKATRLKPIVILKAGKTSEGQQATRSHTGSLAGSPEVFAALLHETGAISVSDMRGLFNALQFLATNKRPHSKEVLIVSNAGGPSILAVDELVRTRLHLRILVPDIQRRLSRILPEGAAVLNPIDLMGDATVERFKNAFRILLSERTDSNILVLITPQAVTPMLPLARYLVSLRRRLKRTLVVCFIGGKGVASARALLTMSGVAQYEYPAEALRTLSDVVVGSRRLSSATLRGAAREFREGTSRPLAYAKVQGLLSRQKLPLLRGRIVRSERELGRVSYPVVMKILARSIIHKATAGGVIAPVLTRADALRAYRLLRQRFRHVELEGVLVQPYCPSRTEFIIGLKRDKLLGAMVVVGAGGTLTELLQDTSMRVAPVTVDEAVLMLAELRSKALLSVRDRRFLAALISKVSRLSETHPALSELDLNPVIMRSGEPLILDARIFEKE